TSPRRLLRQPETQKTRGIEASKAIENRRGSRAARMAYALTSLLPWERKGTTQEAHKMEQGLPSALQGSADNVKRHPLANSSALFSRRCWASYWTTAIVICSKLEFDANF